VNSFIDYIIQGIVQGLTEFLPVSSDGHLSLVQHFLNVSGDGALLGTVLLHLGTLAAVFIVFWKTIWSLIKEFVFLIGDVFTGKFKWKTMSLNRRMVVMIIIATIATFVLLVFPVPGPAAMAEKDVLFSVGSLRFTMMKDLYAFWSEDSDIIVEGICFLITGTLLLMGSRSKKRKTGNDITAKDSILIGLFQGLAALPGVSRSGSTISIGLYRGLPKDYIVQFSFILGIPAILGANVLEIGDAMKEQVSIELMPMLVGVVVAALVGLFAIKALQWLIKNDKLYLFGYYCLILGALTLICGLVELFAGQTIPQMIGG
jgi:undecaprenyl-diphosphatase